MNELTATLGHYPLGASKQSNTTTISRPKLDETRGKFVLLIIGQVRHEPSKAPQRVDRLQTARRNVGDQGVFVGIQTLATTSSPCRRSSITIWPTPAAGSRTGPSIGTLDSNAGMSQKASSVKYLSFGRRSTRLGAIPPWRAMWEAASLIGDVWNRSSCALVTLASRILRGEQCDDSRSIGQLPPLEMRQRAPQAGAIAGAGQPDLFARRAGVVLDLAAEGAAAMQAAGREQPIEL